MSTTAAKDVEPPPPVTLPFSYTQTDATYPTLYVLDANVCFGIVSDLVRSLATHHEEIPELLVVGIGHPLAGLEDWVILRNRDLSPTSDPESDEYWMWRMSQATGRDDIVIVSGGGPRFLAFIREELIPFIESRYRVSPTDRALMGIPEAASSPTTCSSTAPSFSSAT